MKRVYIGGLMHEANAFSPIATPDSAFEAAPFSAPDLRAGDWFGYGDLIEAVRAAGDVALPGVHYMATPSAPCSAATFSRHCQSLLDDLGDQGAVDAVLLFLHGAQTAAGEADCAGALTMRVRQLVGPDCPIGVLLDLHANVTERLLGSADLVAACKEYPHTDFAEVARELWDALKSGKSQSWHAAWRPVPAFPASTTTHGPMKAFVDQLREVQSGPSVVSISAVHGFPHADVDHASAGILVYALTQGHANEMAAHLSASFFDAILGAARLSPGLTLQETIQAMRTLGAGPLLIAERSDNPGAGGAGDSTHLLYALRQEEHCRVALALLHDPEAVDLAVAAGVGSTINLSLGGKANALSGPPFPMTARVLCVRTDAAQPVFEGASSQPLGTSVLLEQDGLHVIANTIRQQPFSPEVFTAHGLDIRDLDVVVVKSTNHFYNCFAPLVAKVIYCDAPGAATEDLSALPYTTLTRPVWPLDSESECRAIMGQKTSHDEPATR